MPLVDHAIEGHAYVVSEAAIALLDEHRREFIHLNRGLNYHLGVLEGVCGATSTVVALGLSILKTFVLEPEVFVLNALSKVLHTGVKEANEVWVLVDEVDLNEVVVLMFHWNRLGFEKHHEEIGRRVLVG